MTRSGFQATSSVIRTADLRLAALSVGLAASVGCSSPASQLGPTSSSLTLAALVSSPSSSSSGLPLAPPAGAGAPCPDVARTPGYPPWHRPFTLAPELCIRGPEGRHTVEKDATDRDGWRHFLVFDGAHGERVRTPITAPTGLARRFDGSVIVLDLKDGVTLVALDGSIRWRSSHPKCGAVDHLALDARGAITFACGYSVVRLEPDGKLAWQKWPFRDQQVRGPWVDPDGAVYVSGAGKVAALASNGEPLWTFSTGNNRAIGQLVWNDAGNLVFDTSMDELHSAPGPSGISFYNDFEPRELFEITRSGKLVKRVQYEGDAPPGGWPGVLPTPEDGAHRAP